MNTVVSVATVCLLVVCILTCTQVKAEQYRIVPTRPLLNSQNLVRLNCRSSTTSGQFASRDVAIFYRNSTSFMVSSADDMQTITFVIDRFVDEGSYSCGSASSDSNQTPVIAYPMLDLQVQFDGVVTIRAKSGSTAILPSYLRSGIWHSRYYIDWEKHGGETVGRIDGLRSPMSVNRVPEGFSVDPANFSLMIESVSRSDSGMYYGRLGVTEGPSSITRSFEQTETMPIVLEVYEEPRVRQEHEEVIVKKEENTNIEFKCYATGYPRPTIHWDHHLYSESSEESVNDNTNDDTVVSTLTLYNAHPEDSGTVGCYAIVEPGGNTAPLYSEMAVAKLSVLKIFAVKVYKTTKDKLVFTVNLGEGIVVPTGLRLQLMEKADTNPHLSPDVYKGTNPITYVYENPPKDLFTSIVNVSVVDSNGHETSEPITMDLSTELDHMCSYYQQIVTVVIPGGVGLIIVALFFVVGFYLLCNKEKARICNELRKTSKDPYATREERHLAFGQLLRHLGCSKTDSCPKSTHNEPVRHSQALSDNPSVHQYETIPPLGSSPTQTTDEPVLMSTTAEYPPCNVLNYTRELSITNVVPGHIAEEGMNYKASYTPPQNSNTYVRPQNGESYNNISYNPGSGSSGQADGTSIGVVRSKGHCGVRKLPTRKRNKTKCSEEDSIALAKDFLML